MKRGKRTEPKPGQKRGMFVLLHVRVGKLEPASIQLVANTGKLVIKTNRSVTRTTSQTSKVRENERERGGVELLDLSEALPLLRG